MSTSVKVLAVTNRKLCQGNFLERIGLLADSPVQAIVLREKDLPEPEYERLAADALAICRQKGKPCILHTFPEVAHRLGCASVHLPLPILRGLKNPRDRFEVLGASVHSVEEAVEAERLGATYLTAGHIFETDCKAGLEGRGLDFLQSVCRSVRLPVYAIGGITPENLPRVLEAGAAGGCMMSSLMTCADLETYLRKLGMNG